MKKKKRLGLKIGIGVLVLLLAALAFAGNYLVDFAIVRKEEAKDVARVHGHRGKSGGD